VAGYCVVNDVSEREYQIERGGTWDKGKGCDTFGPVGPWLVTADEVPDPQALDMWLDVNGHRYQKGSTRTMIFGVAQLVSYVSRFMTLYPGDLITTGTPPGVGMGVKPIPVYLKAGDTMRLGIEGWASRRRACTPGTRPSSTADRDEQPGDPHPRQRQRRHRAPAVAGRHGDRRGRHHRGRPGAAGPQDRHARDRARASGAALRPDHRQRHAGHRPRPARAHAQPGFSDFARAHEPGAGASPTAYEASRPASGHRARRRPRGHAQLHRRADQRELFRPPPRAPSPTTSGATCGPRRWPTFRTSTAWSR
jgi:hypothetical protein